MSSDRRRDTISPRNSVSLGRYDDARYIDQPKDDTESNRFRPPDLQRQNTGILQELVHRLSEVRSTADHGIKRLTNLNIADHERAVAITDPDLFKYPFLYTSEPEQMVLTDQDAAIMREYLARGGFWMLDDFWGSFEMGKRWNGRSERSCRMPKSRIFRRTTRFFIMFYDIDKIIQVPSLAYAINGGITWEQDGFVGECKGMWDDTAGS